ncbi:NAD-dependent epimerase/dehydratase family protein [Sulfurimonas autotrophica]|uniref:NAD-dependent epimerase/dehydratase n=1 Tax=Sulfurimonas autotrophica (strain ATCC BAA-671 / DSM 16294 / JCM 11897 / OK10) TaxID=563040 RepID=E0UUN1_SULAO|nr:NAD-dependent epimerase/dehydratase family protein [Sulfurimonas autotrophica]ADN09535.1 NAD-dependent epimerase/dehydratase [Sulfurimonas autotrophica DSM 16294]
MNLLVTGSSGFVGKYFIEKYADKYNIETFSFLHDDFENLDLNGIDTIVHLSALVHQMGGAESTEYERINVTQSVELANKAKASGVKQFVFMSSVKVYGEETNSAYREKTTCKPEDEYGKSKLKAELELQKLEDESFKVSIIRTPIVYGYGVKANIKNLIGLVQKVSVLPFGDIQNKRSMVYVGNLCFFMDTIIEKQLSGVFLTADERAFSTTELVALIANALGKKVYLIRVPFFESFLKVVKPSFHKRLFGSLEVDNHDTLTRLFGEAKASLPYSIEDGVGFMISGEDR